MAEWKRTKIGDVLKDKKDPKKTYLKIYKDHVLKDGQYINFESKKQKLESLQNAFNEGKISEEKYEKALTAIEKMPDYVLFEAFFLTKE